jgi:hypothetical protein
MLAVHIVSASLRERKVGFISPKVELFFEGRDYLAPEEVRDLFGLGDEWDEIIITENPYKSYFVVMPSELVYEYHAKPDRKESSIILPMANILPEKVKEILENQRKRKSPDNPISASDIQGFENFIRFTQKLS